MGIMSTDFPGLTDAQCELIQHWRTQHDGTKLPHREHLDPGAIRAHLSEISIVEICEDGQTRFRLVGSGLRRVFGRDMRGRRLAELSGDMFEVWSLGLARSFEEQRPIGGLIDRGQDVHAWLRLPLWSDGQSVQVMCHDTLIPRSRFSTYEDAEFDSSFAGSTNIAA